MSVSRSSLSLLIISLLTVACGKQSSSPAFYMTFQVGGKSYTIDSVWATSMDPQTHGFAIWGYESHADYVENHVVACHFQVVNYSSTDTAITGVYSCTQNSPPRSICESSLAIRIPGDANSGGYLVSSINSFTLTVTQNTAEYVSGSFQGQMQGLPISNGKFKLPYIK